MKKLVSGIMFTLLMLGALTLTLNVQPVRSSPATITVPDDYGTIQAAINAANSRDTIYVRNGIYQEYVELNKAVTLKGESNQNTIIEARSSHSSAGRIQIYANNTVIEGFRIIPSDEPDWDDLVAIDGRFISCSNNTIRNNTLVFTLFTNGNCAAIDIIGSENNVVADNQIMVGSSSDAGTNAGISLILSANHNTICNNTVIGGWAGIAIVFADHNNVSNNYLTGQTPFEYPDFGALALTVSSGDIVKGNTLINNHLGFSASQADCSVYHNNFINNTQQVLIERDCQIALANGYPCGGNYWSDYSGTDSFSGAYQNRTGSDGIGDTSYVVDASNVDHYPLMKPWAAHLLGDVNGDGMVDLKDLVLLACAYGSTPACTNWDANADLDGNGRVSLTDLVTLVTHYGQHNP